MARYSPSIEVRDSCPYCGYKFTVDARDIRGELHALKCFDCEETFVVEIFVELSHEVEGLARVDSDAVLDRLGRPREELRHVDKPGDDEADFEVEDEPDSIAMIPPAMDDPRFTRVVAGPLDEHTAAQCRMDNGLAVGPEYSLPHDADDCRCFFVDRNDGHRLEPVTRQDVADSLGLDPDHAEHIDEQVEGEIKRMDPDGKAIDDIEAGDLVSIENPDFEESTSGWTDSEPQSDAPGQELERDKTPDSAGQNSEIPTLSERVLTADELEELSELSQAAAAEAPDDPDPDYVEAPAKPRKSRSKPPPAMSATSLGIGGRELSKGLKYGDKNR